MEKKNEYVITIGFNKKLEEHRKVAGILNGMGRTKAQYIVNAVIAYGAVSYTHLDVYKRQILRSGVFTREE